MWGVLGAGPSSAPAAAALPGEPSPPTAASCEEAQAMKEENYYNPENKKGRNATITRFSTIQPSIDVSGIRNERWQ